MQSDELWSGKKNYPFRAPCTLRIAVTVQFSLPLVTCIHVSYVKILLSILVGRVCKHYTEEIKKKSGELILRRFRTRCRPRSKHPLQIFATVFCLTKCFVLLTQYRAGDKIKKNEMG